MPIIELSFKGERRRNWLWLLATERRGPSLEAPHPESWMNYPTPLNFNDTSTYLSNGFEVCNENEFKRYIFRIAYKPAVLSSPFRTGYLGELSSFLIVCACSPSSLSPSWGRQARGLRCCLRPKEGNLSTGDKTRSDLRDSELGGREEKAQLERSSHPLTTMVLYQTITKVDSYTHVAELRVHSTWQGQKLMS